MKYPEDSWHKAQLGDIIILDMPIWQRRRFWEFWKPRMTCVGSKHYEYVVGENGIPIVGE
jgi:hypothetical protein